MDRPFFCPDCGLQHDEPSDARLGHLVPCLDCALTSDILAYQAALTRPDTVLAA